ncbi:MAG: hypothetical protein K6F16_02550, partial [Lachnospiraceae bacterium]|nr:hypothetical protein [Lachnospiraceae bacterium]
MLSKKGIKVPVTMRFFMVTGTFFRCKASREQSSLDVARLSSQPAVASREQGSLDVARLITR